MPFSFPSSPAVNDQSTQNGRTYSWSGYAWEIVATPAALPASVITSGTLDAARLPLATTLAAGAMIVGSGLGVSSGTVSVTYGTSSGTACQGNDSRLSDSRTPTGAAGGDLTGTYPNPTIAAGAIVTADLANDAVTYAKLQNVSATDRLLGRSSAGSGDVEEITCTSFGRSLIDDADAAAARTTLGVQPTASPTFTGSIQADVSNVLLDSTGNLRVFTTDTQAADKGGQIGLGGKNGFGAPFDPWAFATIKGAKENGTSGNFSGYVVVATSNSGGVLGERLRISSTGTATFAGQILADDIDTANSVAYAFDGDPDTGIGRNGANILTFVTGGTERVRVDASGRVGIGVSPASAGSSAIQVRGDVDIFGNGSDRSVTYNVGVGDDGITGWYRAKIAFVPSGAANNISQHIAFYNKNGDNGGSSLTERMRITAGGELLVGTTTDNGAYLLQVNSQIYATNATIATSDARFKTHVESLTDATAVIEALRPVAFDFIPHAERNFAAERQVGLIAQEAQSALAGTDYADSVVAQCGDHLGLAYEKLVPVLIKALQESNARIAALEEKINA